MPRPAAGVWYIHGVAYMQLAPLKWAEGEAWLLPCICAGLWWMLARTTMSGCLRMAHALTLHVHNARTSFHCMQSIAGLCGKTAALTLSAEG